MGTMVGDPYYAPISTLRSLAEALNRQLKTEIFTILNIFKYPDEGLNFSPFSGMFLWTHSDLHAGRWKKGGRPWLRCSSQKALCLPLASFPTGSQFLLVFFQAYRQLLAVVLHSSYLHLQFQALTTVISKDSICSFAWPF